MMEPEKGASEEPPIDERLTRLIASEELVDSLATFGDGGLNIATQVLGGFPVFGAFVNGYRAVADIRKEMEFRKIVRFLNGLEKASAEDRQAFTKKLRDENRLEEFGQNVLLLLSRLDDMSKPAIIGRVMAAHIEGKINYDKAMRLSAIVDRSYATDLDYLRTFKEGVQRGGADIATMLFSVGLLADRGSDGGEYSDPESGGTLFALNEYGELLLKYGL
ncbi:hypothetical protein [Mesorhizobium sp. M0772]|uniref:hypothetical protein n=1 Tax=Mesorhizobium sp. M0772 TaxID=2956998 RepID=UPI00333505D5